MTEKTYKLDTYHVDFGAAVGRTRYYYDKLIKRDKKTLKKLDPASTECKLLYTKMMEPDYRKRTMLEAAQIAKATFVEFDQLRQVVIATFDFPKK